MYDNQTQGLASRSTGSLERAVQVQPGWIVSLHLAYDPLTPTKDDGPQEAGVDSECSVFVQASTSTEACAIALRIAAQSSVRTRTAWATRVS